MLLRGSGRDEGPFMRLKGPHPAVGHLLANMEEGPILGSVAHVWPKSTRPVPRSHGSWL